MAVERTKGARGAARTELVAVRFDPKTKYLMELAARVQRRSVANYVERAVEESLRNVEVEIGDAAVPLVVAATALWDVEEADRFYYLVKTLPQLLTHDEQVIWKLVQCDATLWKTEDGQHTLDGGALRSKFAAIKYAVNSGADIDTIRSALAGDGAAVESIGLDRWARTQKGAAVPAKKTRKPS